MQEFISLRSFSKFILKWKLNEEFCVQGVRNGIINSQRHTSHLVFWYSSEHRQPMIAELRYYCIMDTHDWIWRHYHVTSLVQLFSYSLSFIIILFLLYASLEQKPFPTVCCPPTLLLSLHTQLVQALSLSLPLSLSLSLSPLQRSL